MARRKFDDIPTESMFSDDEVAGLKEDKPKPERARTIASGRCPECSNMRLGVVRQGDHLLWRVHTYTTWSGAKLTCRASGVATCVAPERYSADYPYHVAVLCPHTKEGR